MAHSYKCTEVSRSKRLLSAMWRGIARNLSYCTSFRQLLDPRYFAVNIVLQRAAGSEGVLGAVLEITLLGGSHGAYQVKKFSACHMFT